LYWSAFFYEELELVAQKTADTGLIAGVVLAAIIAAYFAYKIITQQRFLRSLRMRRLTAEDVHQRIEEGDDFHVIDLRHDYYYEHFRILCPAPSGYRYPSTGIAKESPGTVILSYAVTDPVKPPAPVWRSS